MLVRFTIIEVHLGTSGTRGVSAVDDLLDKIHLLTSCSGGKVDFGKDFVKRFTSMHEGSQVLGSLYKVGIAHSRELDLEEAFDLIVKARADDKTFLLRFPES